MSWLRKDYILERWVIYSEKRAARPSHYSESKIGRERRRCAFCPGNEWTTPPAVQAYRWDDGRLVNVSDAPAFAKNWVVRVVPNLYPLTTRAGSEKDEGNEKWILLPAVGRHEVVIESPDHDDHPGHASIRQTAAALEATLQRVRTLCREEKPKHVSVFRNHRAEAGATISHAHSQIVSTPIVPPLIAEEQASAQNYLKETGNCAFCNFSKIESHSKRRILTTKQFRVFAPWASIAPYEFWIVPAVHEASILKLENVNGMAETLRRCMRALDRTLGDCPYNYSFHSSFEPARFESYHWHLHVYPRLNALAGLEIGGGLYTNTVFPEQAAETLRRFV